MPRARNAIASIATRTPRIVTTRTPLFDEAGWREDGADLGEMRSDIFSLRDLDDPNRVESTGEISFCAQPVLRAFLDARLRSTLADFARRVFVIASQRVAPMRAPMARNDGLIDGARRWSLRRKTCYLASLSLVEGRVAA
jgi:hypothetical protein